MVYYSQREGDQCYQRTPYHSRRSMIQTYYEVEFHLLTLSVLCLMSYVCWLIVFVTYHSYLVCLCSEKTREDDLLFICLSRCCCFCQSLRIISKVAFLGLALPWTPAYPGFEMMLIFLCNLL